MNKPQPYFRNCSETEFFFLEEEDFNYRARPRAIYETIISSPSRMVIGVMIAGCYCGQSYTYALWREDQTAYIAISRGFFQFPLPCVPLASPLGEKWGQLIQKARGLPPKSLYKVGEGPLAYHIDNTGQHINGWYTRGGFYFREKSSFSLPEVEVYRLREGLLFRFQSGRDRLLTGPRPGKVWENWQQRWLGDNIYRQGDLYIALRTELQISHSFGWENITKKKPPFSMGRHIICFKGGEEAPQINVEQPVVIPASRDFVLQHPEHDEILLRTKKEIPEFFVFEFFPGASNPWERSGGD